MLEILWCFFILTFVLSWSANFLLVIWLCLLVHNAGRYVWRSKGEAFKPKKTVPVVKQINIKPLERLNLNPIDNFWTTLEHWVSARKTINLNELYQFFQEKWSNIQSELWK